MAFYLVNDTFNRVAEPVVLDAVVVAFLEEAPDEVVGIVDGKHGVVDIVFAG